MAANVRQWESFSYQGNLVTQKLYGILKLGVVCCEIVARGNHGRFKNHIGYAQKPTKWKVD